MARLGSAQYGAVSVSLLCLFVHMGISAARTRYTSRYVWNLNTFPKLEPRERGHIPSSSGRGQRPGVCAAENFPARVRCGCGRLKTEGGVGVWRGD